MDVFKTLRQGMALRVQEARRGHQSGGFNSHCHEFSNMVNISPDVTQRHSFSKIESAFSTTHAPAAEC
jgi:hypothetical protein